MSELIDRQALKDYVSSLSTHPLNEWDTWGVLAAIDKQPTIAASPWHRVEEPPKEDGWYMLGFLSRWRNGSWWIPEFPDYWMPIEPPKEEEE